MYFILSLKRDGPPPSTKSNQATGQPAFILSFYLLHTCIITGKSKSIGRLFKAKRPCIGFGLYENILQKAVSMGINCL